VRLRCANIASTNKPDALLAVRELREVALCVGAAAIRGRRRERMGALRPAKGRKWRRLDGHTRGTHASRGGRAEEVEQAVADSRNDR
jgi:hypothetical protein